MLCLGGVYGFSIFVPPLISNYGLSVPQTQIIFGFTIASFTSMMFFANRILVKLGYRNTGIIGAVLFSSGYIIASISEGNILLMTFSLGILTGLSLAFGYVCSLTGMARLFPQNQGVATGLAVAGFGAGAILLSQLVEAFLNLGFDIMEIFQMIGIGYGLILLAGAVLLRIPDVRALHIKGSHIELRNIITTIHFWALITGMFFGTFAGLLIIGNLKPIGLDFGIQESTATLAISAFAIGNTFGRIIWGYISDRVGSNNTIIAAFMFSMLSILSIIWGSKEETGFMISCFSIGFGFGANFVVFASEVSRFYGVNNLGKVYSLIFLAYGLAGVSGPVIGGWLFAVSNSYHLAIMVSAISCLAGLVIYLLMSWKGLAFRDSFKKLRSSL